MKLLWFQSWKLCQVRAALPWDFRDILLFGEPTRHSTDILRILCRPSSLSNRIHQSGSLADSPSVFSGPPTPLPMNPSKSTLGGATRIFSRQKHAWQPQTVLMDLMRTTQRPRPAQSADFRELKQFRISIWIRQDCSNSNFHSLHDFQDHKDNQAWYSKKASVTSLIFQS